VWAIPYLDVSSGPLYYAVHRSSAPNPVLAVLIHGAGGSHLSWPAALRRLSPHVTTYLPDLPGHGRSTGPGCSSIEGFADAVLQFCQGLALKGVVLIGHSMGGATATVAALRQPELCRALVLINSAAKFSVPPAILNALGHDHERAVALVCEYALGPDFPPPLGETTCRMLRELPHETLHRDFLACQAFDVTAQLSALQVPTLIIAASDDLLTPLPNQRLLAEHIPHSRLIVMQRAGHTAMLTHAEQIRCEILSFLDLTKY
jgi:pimeloyl-ACP methyl ester carboxylesterase